jgi:cysteine desulfurase / selenocysteine lyase
MRYPGALRRTYLDTACRGLPPREAFEAIHEYCALVREPPGASTTEDTLLAFERMAATRRRVAALVGADVDEIALVDSTQDGLNAAAGALRIRARDNVVCTATEFVGAVLPWRRLGAEVKLVPTLDAADFAAAVDSRTRAVVVSSVQEVTGERADLAALGRVCRDAGVLLVVDGVQHVGPMPLDLRETPVDVLAVGGHKWLCSPFGLGFLYVRGELLPELEPPLRGYMTLAEPAQGWMAYLADPRRSPLDELGWIETAQKLEPGGTGPYLAGAALGGALEALLSLGAGAIAARTQELVQALVDHLPAELVSPREPERRSGIVVFNADDERGLVDRLAAADITVSLRYSAGVGGIRASPYFYNDESDVERLIALIGSAGSRARRAAATPPRRRARAARRDSPA